LTPEQRSHSPGIRNADLAGSTALVKGYKDWFAAEVYKSFLHCASRIIKANNGIVTAFDGDRVMAVFIGGAKRTNAAITALKIKGAVQEIINSAIKGRYTTEYQINHAVGVDLSKAFVARTGVRGSNDLVWIGSAPNTAAKMSDIRELSYHTYITSAVYDRLRDDAKFGGPNNTNMWESWWWEEGQATIYRSNWRWTP